jgi:hypothetical protein
MRLKIEVTKTNIAKGARGCAEKCAVQKALQKALRAKLGLTVNNVLASYSDLSFFKGGYKYVAKTPKKVNRFMERFDDYSIPRSKIKPITFGVRFVDIIA